MQLIFGANGPSGRTYIRTLTDSADTVAVLRRPSEDSFFAEHNIQTVVADALDADALDKALAQYRPDTVISFVGGKTKRASAAMRWAISTSLPLRKPPIRKPALY